MKKQRVATLFGTSANLNAMNDASMTNVPDLISYFFTPEMLKALLYNCLRIDIPDNNMKARVIAEILGPSFEEIGVGTNRTAFFHNGLVVKIALDRRGLIDNFAEYKRSIENTTFLAKTYESNYLINIAEYVTVLDQSEFIAYKEQILYALSQLADQYLFNDIGYTLKNSYNWGKRVATLTEEERELYGDKTFEEPVVLDYGYLYPYNGQKDSIMRCPKCRHKLIWNSDYTKIHCPNYECRYEATPNELRNRMDLRFDEAEDEMISSLGSTKMPNLATIEREVAKFMKGVET